MLTNSASAQGIDIVVPNEYAGSEAPGGLGDVWTSYVFQQVFDASQFANLPTGGASLTHVSWRLDGDFEGPNSYPAEQFGIKASVTTVTPDTLGETFADNITGPVFILADGPFDFEPDAGPVGGPNPFDYRIPVTPFHYDPADGNLLLEFEVVNAPPALYIDFLSEPSPTTRQVSNELIDPNNPPGIGALNPGGVVQLTFLPEPSSFLLAAITALAILPRRRRSFS
ncbi:MAG: hypothetical protein KDA60_08295 [Planctomycetales bacterium]|nr:hypothetical protein [Planctomycetales bacterium]